MTATLRALDTVAGFGVVDKFLLPPSGEAPALTAVGLGLRRAFLTLGEGIFESSAVIGSLLAFVAPMFEGQAAQC